MPGRLLCGIKMYQSAPLLPSANWYPFIVETAIAAGATVVDATAASGVEELDDEAAEITLGVDGIVEAEATSALV